MLYMIQAITHNRRPIEEQPDEFYHFVAALMSKMVVC